jgi:hypothetical protein
MTNPFVYPAAAHVRRHGPSGYTTLDSLRPWLRDEFSFRCVYCLLREQWGRVRGLFDIDHFQPVTQHPESALDYENLLYTCATCNSAKRDFEIPDPLLILTRDMVSIGEDGTLHTESPEAACLIEIMGLNSDETVEFRMLWIGIIALAANQDPELFQRLMTYPADLPDLRRLRPPGGNSRPEGIADSFFAKQQRGELSNTY